MQVCKWPLPGNIFINFKVFPYNSAWNNTAGLYIFAGMDCHQEWTAFYVGQCRSFSGRIPGHEKWGMARLYGATHIHILEVPLVRLRVLLEKSLIHHLQPRLNVRNK